jgi:mannose-6-phosphate isomerase-like protein (cupin superfamily)
MRSTITGGRQHGLLHLESLREEIHYFVNGGMSGMLDGVPETTHAGDLVWVSTDGIHGFVNENNEPARWIEVQSPIPPTSDAIFFPDDWRNLPADH